jgi:hypothetical protein
MEEKRDMRMAALIFGGIVILLIFLGVFGLKLMPKIVNLLSNSNRVNKDKNDLIPPPPPTLSIPYVATNSAVISISGQSEPGSQVYLTQNSNSIGNSRTENDGVFRFDTIELAPGSNLFKLVAMDPSGNQSPPSASYVLEYIAKPPEINIDFPEDNQTVSSKRLVVKGSTNPQNKLFINDRFIMLGSTGTFETTINLNVGENKLRFVASDRAGGQTEKELTINLE